MGIYPIAFATITIINTANRVVTTPKIVASVPVTFEFEMESFTTGIATTATTITKTTIPITNETVPPPCPFLSSILDADFNDSFESMVVILSFTKFKKKMVVSTTK